MPFVGNNGGPVAGKRVGGITAPVGILVTTILGAPVPIRRAVGLKVGFGRTEGTRFNQVGASRTSGTGTYPSGWRLACGGRRRRVNPKASNRFVPHGRLRRRQRELKASDATTWERQVALNWSWKSVSPRWPPVWVTTAARIQAHGWAGSLL